MTVPNRTRLLGIYLLCCVAYQVAIYFFPSHFPDPSTISPRYYHYSWFEFANPRVGLDILRDRDAIHLAYLISAAWLFIMAVAIATMPRQRIALQLYVLLECVQSLPTILFLFGTFLVSNIRIAKDIALQVGVLIFLGFSVLPCGSAMWILHKMSPRKHAALETENVEQANS